jgi:serine/threonine protein kinase
MTAALPRNLTLSAWRHVDAICDEFDRAWRDGGRPRAEEFLQPVDEPAQTRLLRELILLEVEYRRAAGESPTRAEYVERFPEQQEAVGQAFDNSLSDTVQLSDFQVAPEDTVPPTIVMSPAYENRPLRSRPHEGDLISRPPRDDANVGRLIGMYRLEEWLGGGGMGNVYRATHTAIHSERAVKLMRETLAQDESAIQRLFREAQAAITHLSHPNIAKTFELLRDEDEFYLLMELIDGCDLARLVDQKGPLSFSEAVQIIEQAATGLAYAHEQGLVHRDVKPQNLMLTTGGTVKILDFGLVGVIEDASGADLDSGVSHTATSDALARMARLTDGRTMMGTLPYMPPEQTRGPRKAEARSDLYSLGCTFYFLLTGRAAFTGSTPAEILSAVRSAQFPSPRVFRPEIPPPLESIVMRLMRARPEERFASAKQLARTLRSWRLQEQLEGLQVSSDAFTFETREELGEILTRLRIVPELDWKNAVQMSDIYRTESRRRMTETELMTVLSETASGETSLLGPDPSDIDAREVNRALEALTVLTRLGRGRAGCQTGKERSSKTGTLICSDLKSMCLLKKSDSAGRAKYSRHGTSRPTRLKPSAPSRRRLWRACPETSPIECGPLWERRIDSKGSRTLCSPRCSRFTRVEIASIHGSSIWHRNS